MVRIPILRQGCAYESVEQATLVHHATREPFALVDQANSGMVRRDILLMDDNVLDSFSIADLIEIARKAGQLFVSASLPLGETQQSFDNYIGQLSATTGMPVAYCRNNAKKISGVLDEIESVLTGLTRGLDMRVLDRGYRAASGLNLNFYRAGRIFGAVLPSNSPGVHSLWAPAIVLKTPIAVKPGREEPWTPYRIIEAFAAAGIPREAMGFYPTDHAGAGELLRSVDRAMLFGGGATVKPYENNPNVELHGPGYSKIILGEDVVDDWEQYIDLMASSIDANGGRSCINASAIWAPRHTREIAAAVAQKLATHRALPADDPEATLAAFTNPAVAEQINAAIEHGLSGGGAVDLCREHRGSDRLARLGACSYLLPAVVRCDSREHLLANREFLFPYASVVECPENEMPDAIGPSLVATVLTRNEALIRTLMNHANVDRLNVGAIPTWKISWDQPHEGNLFELLYRQRAFQIEPAA
ncbi:MAG: aldehyde dehydrogenase [Planctomycetes bacterium]|nr:aldehyde dehydrogenase [Planctomycetota bacterium]